MTQKDYIAIASVLNEAWNNGEFRSSLRANPKMDADDGFVAGMALITAKLADCLSADNPRFDRQRFYAASTKER